MGKLVLGTPRYSDVNAVRAPVFSGGGWSSSLPVSNLQSSDLSLPARTTNASPANTQFIFDLAALCDVRAFYFLKHNLSSAAKARIRAWSTAPFLVDQDMSGYTNVGPATVTTGQADPMGGTRAVLVDDDDAAGVEYIRTTIGFTGDGDKVFAITLKAGTATVASILLRDDTASVNRAQYTITWSGGVPSVAMTIGTLVSSTAIGGGWYTIIVIATGVVAANTNHLRLNGATSGLTGSTVYYEALAWNVTTSPMLHDSLVFDAWPSGLTAEEAALDGWNRQIVHLLAAATSLRYGRVEFGDAANADGYLELARGLILGGYEPTINMDEGAKTGFETSSTVKEAEGGTEHVDVRAKRRVADFALSNAASAEAIANWTTMEAREGISGQILFVFDTEDSALNMHRGRAFLGRLEQLSPISHPYYSRQTKAFKIREVL